jgi:hypothetical protein
MGLWNRFFEGLRLRLWGYQASVLGVLGAARARCWYKLKIGTRLMLDQPWRTIFLTGIGRLAAPRQHHPLPEPRNAKRNSGLNPLLRLRGNISEQYESVLGIDNPLERESKGPPSGFKFCTRLWKQAYQASVLDVLGAARARYWYKLKIGTRLMLDHIYDLLGPGAFPLCCLLTMPSCA